MNTYELLTLVLALTISLGYLNHRLFKLPSAIALTLLAVAGSLVIMGVDHFCPQWGLKNSLEGTLAQLPFEEAVLHWMLGFLLFAGALHVEFETLLSKWKTILSLATLGVLISTLLIGTLLYYLSQAVEGSLSFLDALLFGALISPTDPVAVLSVLKKVRIPKRIEIVVSGESLLNDGVAVVLFLGLLEIAKGSSPAPFRFLLLFIKEALGGLLLGTALGYLFFWLLKTTDDYELEVLMTITLVMIIFSLADRWHLSGPLGVVAAGLFIGNQGRRFAMSPRTVEHVDTFWRLLDGLLNATLFLLLGLEVVILKHLSLKILLLSVSSLVIVLLTRLVSVWISMKVTRPLGQVRGSQVFFLGWCGVRGGIAVALALSLPPGNEKNIILTLTYAVVLFSVVFQGLTLQPLIRRLQKQLT